MLYLSKSKYCGLWQCPKIAWLKKYRPEAFRMDEDAISRIEAGNAVGDLAMGLFGDFVEVTAYHGDHLDLSAMIATTKREMEHGTHVICEASFSYNGLYCAVDILTKPVSMHRQLLTGSFFACLTEPAYSAAASSAQPIPQRMLGDTPRTGFSAILC